MGIVAIGLGLSFQAHAALIAYDSFSYATNATVVGQGTDATWSNPGYKWTGVDTAKAEAPGNDYDYHGLAHSGNVVDVKGLNEGIYRQFGQSFSTTGREYWVSIVLDVDSNISDSYAGISLYNTYDTTKQEQFFIGQDYLNSNWSMELSANSTRGVSSTPIRPQSAVTIVVQFDGIHNVAKLYVNPASLGGTAPTTPSATLDLTGHEFSFNEIRIQSSGKQVMDADEFRLGTTYADVTPAMVVPEPDTGKAVGIVLAVTLVLHTVARKRRGGPMTS